MGTVKNKGTWAEPEERMSCNPTIDDSHKKNIQPYSRTRFAKQRVPEGFSSGEVIRPKRSTLVHGWGDSLHSTLHDTHLREIFQPLWERWTVSPVVPL